LADVGEGASAHEHGELVSAETGEHIVVGQYRVHSLGEADQDLVTDVMTQGVVDVLEVVEVEHEHCRAVEVVRRGQFGVNGVVEGGTVQVPGEVVVRRCMLHRAVQAGLAQRGRQMTDEGGAARDVVVVESASTGLATRHDEQAERAVLVIDRRSNRAPIVEGDRHAVELVQRWRRRHLSHAHVQHHLAGVVVDIETAVARPDQPHRFVQTRLGHDLDVERAADRRGETEQRVEISVVLADVGEPRQRHPHADHRNHRENQ
jgi:hypothetical protein